MAHLALRLLGHFQAALDGEPAKGLTSDRLRALLAYLAVEGGREHAREALAGLLWPEQPDREAVSALRHALANLRSALGDPGSPAPFLLVTRTTVQFNAASDHWLDVAEFEHLTPERQRYSAGLAGRLSYCTERREGEDLSCLTAAVELYRGPFLHGLSVAHSPAFDDWLLLKGEEYRRGVLGVLGRLSSLQAARGEHAEAARWARRQLEIEPFREEAHRQLMAALALGGERSGALAHYEACRRLLAKELGCEPDDETRALFTQIRDGTLPRARPSLPTEVSLAPPAEGRPHLSAGGPPAPRFVAREEELARLGVLLDRALAGRGGVALIAGEAGSGKTALLDEFAQRAGLGHPELLALRGSCNAHGGAGDPYLPFREILQTLAGDVEGKGAGGTVSPEQALRAWEALPAVGAALVEHGPDLIDTFVPGEALLRRAEAFLAPAGGRGWQAWLRELALSHGRPGEGTAPAAQPDLFAQVTRVLHLVSLRSPLLLAVDDLQWADGGTAALLFHIGRRLAGSRILLACAFRPEALYETPDLRRLGDLGGLGSVLQELVREWGEVLVDLDQADGRGFVEALVDSEPNRLGAGFRQALYDHTEGNPLFTVELLGRFERQGALVQDAAGHWMEAHGLNWDHCPARVEAVIAGHLAGLPDEDRTLLQAASVQGEQFVSEVAARVLGWDEGAVVRRLSGPLRTRHRLVRADRLERLASSGQRLSHYRFRHSLVQRSAYGSVDAVERARLHEATGRALEAVYAEGEWPAGLAAALARHYEAAGLHLPAARALHDAGRQDMRLSAFRQALNRFDHGLALLADEPRSPERSEIQRLLELARLGPQIYLVGPASAKVAGALARAAERGAGDAQGRPKLTMLSAEAMLLAASGQLEDGLAVAQALLNTAMQWEEESFADLAHWWFGFIYNLMGKAQESERHFDRVLAGLTPHRGAELRAAIGFDIKVHALTFSAINQWFLGYPEKALARSTEAVTVAIEQEDPYGRVFASAIGSATLFLLRSDAAALQERAEMAHRLCLDRGYPQWQALAEVFVGWLAVMRGDDAGIERMQGAIASYQAQGMAVGTDVCSLVLTDACLAAGRCPPPTPLSRTLHRPDTAPAALRAQCRCGPTSGRVPTGPEGRCGDYRDNDAERATLLATALAAIEPLLGPKALCGQSYQAELHRVRGELLLARDGLDAAEEALACFERAMQIGAEQGALALELRAAMSLVRLRQRQHGPSSAGCRGEAEGEGGACAAELAEARACLRALYGRFTEGFAFPDLQEAAALIGE